MSKRRTFASGKDGLLAPPRTQTPATSKRAAGGGAVEQALRGPGQPLDAATRAYMEPRFGQDFSHIRVHSDNQAAESAGALDANAYSVGRDLVFGAGQFAPHTPGGRRLLAHELAHAAQPKAAGPARLSRPGDASEREADAAADAVAAGASARVSAPAAAISRDPRSAGDGLLDHASPFLAAAVASTTLDNFDTGKAELKPEHQAELTRTAHRMQILLGQYPLSTVAVTGHADTVDTEAKNLALGQIRAIAVKKALVDLGIPEGIISADSKGEGAPQAVKTPDETPNAHNRRVEVLFRPQGGGLAPSLPPLKLPQPGAKQKDEYDPPAKPPIDLNYHPHILDDEPRPPFRPKQPDIFNMKIPPAPQGSGPQSALDVIGKKILDPVIDAVAGKLPKDIRDKLKDGARSAVKAGVAKGARAAAQAAGITDPQGLDAIENAAKAAIQEKGTSSP